MKKYIVAVLIFISALSFVGCNNDSKNGVSGKSVISTQSQASVESSVNVNDEGNINSGNEVSEESIYISDDPNEYVKYLGQWLPTGGENCVMEIIYPDDKEYSITISCNEAGFMSEWMLTGVFEAENGGIHYTGSVKEKMEDGTEQTRNNCEGFLRLGEDGLMKWRDSDDIRGNNLIFKRTDT